MTTEIDNPNGEILMLPWNRRPNHVICLVALIFLVAGIVALWVAIGMAQGVQTLDGVVGTGFIGLFGLLFIWAAWCFRTGLLPVRFVVDAGRRECGFRWGRWWNGRFDLADADRLIGAIRFRGEQWQWAIQLPAKATEQTGQWIYGSGKPFDSVEAAERDCRAVIGRIGEHLALPFEICIEAS